MATTDDKVLGNKIKARFDQLESERIEHETAWRKIAQWLQPRRSFTIERAKNQLVRRRIVDMTATRSGERLAALLHGYLIDTHEPWIEAHLRGRAANPRERRWFDAAERDMHRFMTGSRSTFRSALMESVTDDVFFGNSVLFSGASAAGRQPGFMSLPLFECYWAENEEGVVDTLYRKFRLTLKNSVQRFRTKKLVEKAERKNADLSERFTFIQAVEPRAFGVRGDIPSRKPFSSVIYSYDTEEVAKVSGFDAFPFAVTRFQRQSGDVYGTGPGWTALPMAVLANMILETIMESAEQAARPSLIDLSGKLAKLDRRPGAVNRLNAAELMLMEPGQVIQKLYEGGDVGDAFQVWTHLIGEIELIFYVDWMRRQGTQPPSATQVNDERDIRLQSLSGVVGRAETEKMTPIADRTFDGMLRADMFSAEIPDSLFDNDVDFVYRSPLAIAQKRSRLSAIASTLDLVGAMAAFDEEVTDVPDFDAMARDGMSAAGLPLKYQRTEDDIAERREARRRAAEESRQIENAAGIAGAARDAGQAAASLGIREAA